jgi:phosphate starvation-inducible protein PhoH
LLTRIGEGTKMFICGDAMQSDIGSKSGFMRIYDLFNDKESEERGIYCFQFDEEDIMRSEILKYIVKVFKKLDKTNTH